MHKKRTKKKAKSYHAFILKRKFVLFYNKYISDLDLFEEAKSNETIFFNLEVSKQFATFSIDFYKEQETSTLFRKSKKK